MTDNDYKIRPGTDLKWADLQGADLLLADLLLADLQGANLQGADLRWANLSEADLSEANLRRANLRGADLRGANLSEAVGLPDGSEIIRQLERDDIGFIVYKRFGETEYDAPSQWSVEPGAFISENVNPCRTGDCACGVSVGTREWCDGNYVSAELWRCRIWYEDAHSIVVPYHTDGKFRCGRLELLEVVSDE